MSSVDPPTDEMPHVTEWQNTKTDEHGDFLYTLRQYLLMRRLNLGGDWTDVCNDVSREVMQNYTWDVDARDTYSNWTAWYRGDRAVSDHD